MQILYSCRCGRPARPGPSQWVRTDRTPSRDPSPWCTSSTRTLPGHCTPRDSLDFHCVVLLHEEEISFALCIALENQANAYVVLFPEFLISSSLESLSAWTQEFLTWISSSFGRIFWGKKICFGRALSGRYKLRTDEHNLNQDVGCRLIYLLKCYTQAV